MEKEEIFFVWDLFNANVFMTTDKIRIKSLQKDTFQNTIGVLKKFRIFKLPNFEEITECQKNECSKKECEEKLALYDEINESFYISNKDLIARGALALLENDGISVCLLMKELKCSEAMAKAIYDYLNLLR